MLGSQNNSQKRSHKKKRKKKKEKRKKEETILLIFIKIVEKFEKPLGYYYCKCTTTQDLFCILILQGG
jgi:hypothetical protein